MHLTANCQACFSVSSVVNGVCQTALIDVLLVSAVGQGEKKALEPGLFLCLRQMAEQFPYLGLPTSLLLYFLK